LARAETRLITSTKGKEILRMVQSGSSKSSVAKYFNISTFAVDSSLYREGHPELTSPSVIRKIEKIPKEAKRQVSKDSGILPKPPKDEGLLRVSTASKLYKIPYSTIYMLIKKGKLSTYRSSLGGLRVKEEELATYKSTIIEKKPGTPTIDLEVLATKLILKAANSIYENEELVSQLKESVKQIKEQDTLIDKASNAVEEASSRLVSMEKELEEVKAEKLKWRSEAIASRQEISELKGKVTRLQEDTEKIRRVHNNLIVTINRPDTSSLTLAEICSIIRREVQPLDTLRVLGKSK
jgi:excisionase family DNA binding protein